MLQLYFDKYLSSKKRTGVQINTGVVASVPGMRMRLYSINFHKLKYIPLKEYSSINRMAISMAPEVVIIATRKHTVDKIFLAS